MRHSVNTNIAPNIGGVALHQMARVAGKYVVCVEAGAELILVNHVMPHPVFNWLGNVVLRAEWGPIQR